MDVQRTAASFEGAVFEAEQAPGKSETNDKKKVGVFQYV